MWASSATESVWPTTDTSPEGLSVAHWPATPSRICLARSVKAYLEGKASGVKIAASGKGETQPAASETNPDGSVSEVGKAANRRVEIRWKK